MARIVGLGERPEDTVIKGGGPADCCSIFQRWKAGNVLSNLTFTGGWAPNAIGGVADGSVECVDCVFSNNFAAAAGAVPSDSSPLTRCRFVNNRASGNSGAITTSGGVLIRDCVFEGNVAGGNGGVANSGNAVYSNCTFVGNSAKQTGLLGVGWSTTVMVDCVLSNNTSSSKLSLIDARDGYLFLTNCIIAGNWMPKSSSGQMITGGRFSGCTIVGNSGPNLLDGRLERCVLRGNFSNGASGPLFQKVSLYNSLLEGNDNSADTKGNPIVADGSFYNCTIVSNFVYGTSASAVANGSAAVNTVFAGNVTRDPSGGTSVRSDMVQRTYPAAMTNCMWTAQDADMSTKRNVLGCRLVTDDDLRFADPAGGSWRIGKSSVARDAGWSDDAYLELLGAFDLVGNRRVTEDGVDVGAYEWRPPLGAIMIVR